MLPLLLLVKMKFSKRNPRGKFRARDASDNGKAANNFMPKQKTKNKKKSKTLRKIKNAVNTLQCIAWHQGKISNDCRRHVALPTS